MTVQRDREFKGWHMLAVMVAFFGIVIAVNLTLAVLANTTWTGLIVTNGYDASQNYSKEQERQRAQTALGWQAHVVHEAGELRVEMTGVDGHGLSGLKVSCKLRRTVNDREDKTLELHEIGQGKYSSAVMLGSGLWELEVDAEDSLGHSFSEVYRFTTKG